MRTTLEFTTQTLAAEDVYLDDNLVVGTTLSKICLRLYLADNDRDWRACVGRQFVHATLDQLLSYLSSFTLNLGR